MSGRLIVAFIVVALLAALASRVTIAVGQLLADGVAGVAVTLTAGAYLPVEPDAPVMTAIQAVLVAAGSPRGSPWPRAWPAGR